MEIKYNTHNSCTVYNVQYIHLNIYIHLHTKIPGIAIHCFLGERAEAAMDYIGGSGRGRGEVKKNTIRSRRGQGEADGIWVESLRDREGRVETRSRCAW